MANLLPLLAALMMSVSALQGGARAPFSPWACAAILLAHFLSGRLAADLLAARAGDGAADPERGLARFRRMVSLHRLLSLAAHAAVLWWPGGWSDLLARLQAGGSGLAALAAAVVPYPILLAVSALSTFPAERHLGLQALSLPRQAMQSARVFGMLLAPILLFAILALGTAMLDEAGVPPFPALADFAARWDFVAGVSALAVMACVMATFPVLAMRILGARPMPPGSLRDRLEAYARRVGLGYRDLYVWPTHGTMLNAAVMGVGRRLRCVVFTDALLERLDDEEVEAVFAHEAGHAVHHHLPLLFLFTSAFGLAMSAASSLLPVDLAMRVEESGVVAVGLAIAAYFGLLFGLVSRRIEQQADVHGFLTVGLPEGESPARVLAEPDRHPFLEAVAEGRADPADHPFVRSLDRIAAIMGGIREITGWRHFSIADRVDFLERFARDPGVRERYRSRLRGLFGLMGVVFLMLAAGASADLPVQAAGPDPVAALDRAQAALARRDVARARRWIEDGLRGAKARGRMLSPAAQRVPAGRPVEDLSLLAMAQAPEDATGTTRFRLRECEALLRSVLGRDEEAAAVMLSCLEGLDRAPEARPDRAPARPSLRSEGLLVLADVLERGRRPAAAAAARAARGDVPK